jgi:hypothetical protein
VPCGCGRAEIFAALPHALRREKLASGGRDATATPAPSSACAVIDMAVAAGAGAPVWCSGRADQALRCVAESNFFALQPELAVAARSTCRGWRTVVRECTVPRLVDGAPGGRGCFAADDLAGWCASFPLATRVSLDLCGDETAAAEAGAALATMSHLREVALSRSRMHRWGHRACTQVIMALPRSLTTLLVHGDPDYVSLLHLVEPLLPSLPALTRFEAGGCVQLKQALVAALPATVTSARLGCYGEADANVRLTPLASLRRLQLPAMAVCNPDIVASITPHLTALTLAGVGVSPITPALCARWPHLQELEVASEDFVCHGQLSALPPSLTRLRMRSPTAVQLRAGPSLSLSHLPRLDRLTHTLGDARHELSEYDRYVRTFPPSLRHVGLDDVGITPLLQLSHLPALVTVCLRRTSASDALVASLPPTVTELELLGCDQLTSGCSFAHLPRLRKLMIPSGVLAEGGVAAASLTQAARAAASPEGVASPIADLTVADAALGAPTPDLSFAASADRGHFIGCNMAGWSVAPLAAVRTLVLANCTRFGGLVTTATALEALQLSQCSDPGAVTMSPTVTNLEVSWLPVDMGPMAAGLREARIVLFRRTAPQLTYDWSGTALERLEVAVNENLAGGAIVLHSTILTTLPPTLRVLKLHRARFGLPESADGTMSLDLAHLPLLQRLHCDLPHGHAPIVVSLAAGEMVLEHAQCSACLEEGVGEDEWDAGDSDDWEEDDDDEEEGEGEDGSHGGGDDAEVGSG